jgi:hAT family C-terminal dimerisation region
MFEHLEDRKEELARKQLLWKVNIREAIEDALEKLKQYYSQTCQPKGLLYNLGNILDPRTKMETYKHPDWDDYQTAYRKEFLEYYQDNYQSFEPSPTENTATRVAADPDLDDIDAMAAARRIARRPTTLNEAEKYLEEPIVTFAEKQTILQWWKVNESSYPTLSRMVRDVLAVPIASVGVERIFSHARDVVTYRRNRLKATTLKDILMVRSYEAKQLDQELLPPEELQAIREDLDSNAGIGIGIDEEGEHGSRENDRDLVATLQTTSTRRTKRRSNTTTDREPGMNMRPRLNY